jgi:hypothetical protein
MVARALRCQHFKSKFADELGSFEISQGGNLGVPFGLIVLLWLFGFLS